MTQQKPRILIIDDTPIMLRLLNTILRDDYDMMFAKSGGKGIESAKKDTPDMILLDIMMPDMSGFDVLTALKSDETTESIPIILMTASDSIDDEEKGYDLGAVDYIRKPFVNGIVKRRVKFNMDFIAMKRALKEV